MELPQLEIRRGQYMQIYTPPSPLVQRPPTILWSVEHVECEPANLPTLTQNVLGSAATSVKSESPRASRESRLGLAGQGAMIYSDDLLAVAKRIFWFGTPEEALEFPKRFLTYAMTYASDQRY